MDDSPNNLKSVAQNIKNNIFSDNQNNNNNINEINNISLTVQPPKSLNATSENDNYLFNSYKKNVKINNILLLILLLLIIIEIFYRQPLFNFSLTYEQNLQTSLSKISIFFFRCISFLTVSIFLIIGILIIFWYCTLIKFFIFLFVLIFTVYIHSLMKIFYANPRPFWINENLFKGECQGGFGNPSGHSMISFYFYMTFAYFFINDISKNNSKINIILSYLISFIWCCLVAFSRLVLGVHSINQVIYGGSMGFMIFIISIIVFNLYEMPIKYYLKFFKEKNYIIYSIISIISLILLSIISYFICNSNNNEYNINKNCQKVKKYKIFYKEGLFGTMSIIALFGFYFGQFYFWNKTNLTKNYDDEFVQNIEENINKWNKYQVDFFKSKEKIFKVLRIIIVCAICGVIYLVIPGDINLLIVFIFKVGLPFFLMSFMFSGPGLYWFLIVIEGKNGSLFNDIE